MFHDDMANYEKCMVLLEIHSEIEQEGAIMRFVKTVVADVGKIHHIDVILIIIWCKGMDFRSFCSVRIPIMIGGKPYCVFSSIKKVKSFFYYFVVSSFLIIFAPNYKRL